MSFKERIEYVLGLIISLILLAVGACFYFVLWLVDRATGEPKADKVTGEPKEK